RSHQALLEILEPSHALAEPGRGIVGQAGAVIVDSEARSHDRMMLREQLDELFAERPEHAKGFEQGFPGRQSKTPARDTTQGPRRECRSESDLDDVRRLLASVAFDDIELDAVATCQGPEAITGNGSEMHEDLVTAHSMDEAKALGAVEPLDLAL